MSVKYVVVERGNPSKPTDPKKFYGTVKSSGEISLRSLSKDISSISTVSAVDVMAVLEGLIEVLPRRISEGNIVRLGDFGSFSITLKAEGQEKKVDVTATTIKGVKLHFRPGAVVKNSLKELNFTKEDVK